MTPNTLFFIIIGIMVMSFIIDKILDYLNAQHYNNPIPEELNDVYDEEEYIKSQKYKVENHRFGVLTSTISLLATLAFFFLDGFAIIDNLARSTSDNSILIALVFFGIIMFASDLLGIPFSYYHTFVIEEKYGFNKTTKRTFLLDKIKGWLMLAIIGGGLLSVIVWFYDTTGEKFWLYTWGIITAFIFFMNLFYTRLIVPIFNKQTPLEEGSLRSKN